MTEAEIKNKAVKEYYRRAAQRELARRYFWEYCKLISPDFYKEDRVYLKRLCETLDKFYKQELINPKTGSPYKKLMMNLPPQHGKSRTLIMFCQWMLGNNNRERIILGSYNDDTATDFSRYARDGISQEKIDNSVTVFADVFPETKVKRGNSSYTKWSLEGQHFNYLGAGVGGSVTSKGASVLIIDDLIKGAIEAMNDGLLEKQWLWYQGTFLSRVSAEGGEPLEIVNMTRWSKNDVCGKILSSTEAEEWFILKEEVFNEETGEMLCSDVMSYKRYLQRKSAMAKNPITLMVFLANYHQMTIDAQGKLYKEFKTYSKLPSAFQRICAYVDTADEGDDYLCSLVYGEYEKEAYILDIIYTKEGMEITEGKVALQFLEHSVNEATIESNNGGRGFARNVERILKEKYGSNKTVIGWFHQSQNKKARILTNASWVQEHIYYPETWMDKYSAYHEAMQGYQKEGKNAHDDAPDATTGIGESITGAIKVIKRGMRGKAFGG